MPFWNFVGIIFNRRENKIHSVQDRITVFFFFWLIARYRKTKKKEKRDRGSPVKRKQQTIHDFIEEETDFSSGVRRPTEFCR